MEPARLRTPSRLRLSLTALMLGRALADACAAEAETFYPLETGGLFLGVTDGAGRRIVEHVVGAGSGARRGRTWLEVDDVWQNERIAELAAGRPDLAYIGEWHSHPDAVDACPSAIDRKTLLCLSRFVPLRCPEPIMVIFHPDRQVGAWRAGAWVLAGDPKPWRRIPAAKSVDIVLT